ncbi:hypothetical protein Barb6_00074 [Bacteroidales bacterium Barb6]|nr:hypothetical protein Barb6_00074 [Bacteroidales bacterium Barb6]
MIKLDLPAKPEQLTDEFVVESTQAFKDGTNKSPWSINWLKEAVGEMAFGKCCYSEVRLNEESKYMEVEHFFPKSIYPDDVMKWGNLLPSCKKCNATKREHDTGKEPIVNPFTDNPKEYFYIEESCYRVKEQSEKGKRTIKKLALNHNHFLIPRNAVSEKIKITLNDLAHDIYIYECDLPEYIKRFKRLLKEGDRKEEYAALVATTILEENSFLKINNILHKLNLWDDELQALKEELAFCSLRNAAVSSSIV